MSSNHANTLRGFAEKSIELHKRDGENYLPIMLRLFIDDAQAGVTPNPEHIREIADALSDIDLSQPAIDIGKQYQMAFKPKKVKRADKHEARNQRITELYVDDQLALEEIAEREHLSIDRVRHILSEEYFGGLSRVELHNTIGNFDRTRGFYANQKRLDERRRNRLLSIVERFLNLKRPTLARYLDPDNESHRVYRPAPPQLQKWEKRLREHHPTAAPVGDQNSSLETMVELVVSVLQISRDRVEKIPLSHLDVLLQDIEECLIRNP